MAQGYPGGYGSPPTIAYPQYSPYPSAGYSGYGPPNPYPPGPQPWRLPWQDDYTQTYLLEDPYERRAFIRKVYSILMVQLMATAGIISVFIFVKDVKVFVFTHPWLLWVAIGIQFFTLIALVCCTSLRRQVPFNYIFLFIYTISVSFMLGVVTSTFNTHTLYMAAGITAAICLGLTLFAFQTKWDFTVMGGMLVCCLVVLMIFGIAAYFIRNRIMTLVYSCVGALLFSFYLVYDTQLLMGGKHRYTISPEEYVFAALSLYIDIINIFLNIYSAIVASREDA